MLKTSQDIKHGLLWCAAEDNFPELVQQHMSSIKSFSATRVKDTSKLTLKEPTKFYVNGFTEVFQTLINMYGIPMYKTANPMPTTAIMFPFLFGVMFGDIFHGILLFLFGIYVAVAMDIGKPYRGAGWLLTLCGFFSTFCGLIYNDFNALSTQIFGKTCWGDANGYVDVSKMANVSY